MLHSMTEPISVSANSILYNAEIYISYIINNITNSIIYTNMAICILLNHSSTNGIIDTFVYIMALKRYI